MMGLHTWMGILAGWVLYFVFITGTPGYFQAGITRWMQPERPLQTQTNPDTLNVTATLNAAQTYLQTHGAHADRWFIVAPDNVGAPLRVFWSHADKPGFEQAEVPVVYATTPALNTTPSTAATTASPAASPPATAAAPKTPPPVAPRETGGGAALYEMHYMLHFMPGDWAMWIVGAAAMFMLVAILTGVVAHKKILSETLVFRANKGQRSWLDAHNLIGTLALPFMLMITYSGLAFYMTSYLPTGWQSVYGTRNIDNRLYNDETNLLGPVPKVIAPAAGSPPAAPAAPFSTLLARTGVLPTTPASALPLDLVSVVNPDTAQQVVVLRSWQTGQGALSPGMWRFDGLDGRLTGHLTLANRGLNTVLSLHAASFADVTIHVLYFVLGLMGTTLVGTGLVYWVVKRRARYVGKTDRQPLWLITVEHINVGVIAGLPVSIAVYFWANRLIPATMAGRAAMEMNALFLAWAACLLYAAVRSVKAGWRDTWAVAAALYLLLPVLNIATTDRGLTVTIPRGDWGLASFDLTSIAFGLVFAAIAWKVHCRKVPTRRPLAVSTRQQESQA